MTLGLRFSRRMVAAVALDEERIVFHHFRYVSKGQTRMARYLATLLEQLRPGAVCYYAPTSTQTVTESLATRLQEETAKRGVPVIRVGRVELLASLGLDRIRTRRDLLLKLQDLWPILTHKSEAQLAMSEAVVSALIGDFRQTLPA